MISCIDSNKIEKNMSPIGILAKFNTEFSTIDLYSAALCAREHRIGIQLLLSEFEMEKTTLI